MSQCKINLLYHVTTLSALVVIGFWFLLQFLSSFSSPEQGVGGEESGGVAYMAHIGGFIAGLAVAALLRLTDQNPKAHAE